MIILPIVNTLLLGAILIILLMAAGSMVQSESKAGMKLCSFLCAALIFAIAVPWILFALI